MGSAERRPSALVVHLLAALLKEAAECPGERRDDGDRVDLHEDVEDSSADRDRILNLGGDGQQLGRRPERGAAECLDLSAGESERRELLLEKSEALDSDCVRTRLERLDDDLSPQDQLEFLADLETDDRPLASLIAARRALAHLQASDLGAAETEIKRAQELEPDSIAVQIAQVNLDLHAGVEYAADSG